MRTLHKSARVRFSRRKTYSKGPGDLFQIDLADLVNISSHNDGYRYLLTCIDVFTKRAWAVPTKTKTGREVSRAFEKILTDGYKPNMVQSDEGTAFLNSMFQSMLKRQDIKFYTSENEDIKAAVVEGFNRTLKTISPLETPDAMSTSYPICCIPTIIRITDRSVWPRRSG